MNAMQMPSQDTGKFRKNTKDQFYTKLTVAAAAVQTILTLIPDAAAAYSWLEPSAGTGAFLESLPPHVSDKHGIDIDPKAPYIETADFLNWTPTPNKSYLLFGNPPFGRQSTMAKAFIRKGCEFATVIAFILPRSFTKPSMSNAFKSEFHCLHSADIGPDAFVLNGSPYSVPAVFQVWIRQETEREVTVKVKERGFKYVKSTEPYDIAFRRVGVNAGTSYSASSGKTFSPQSHYFWKVDRIHILQSSIIDCIIAKINAHVFPTNTVGPRSLSKTEANEVMNEILRPLLPRLP